MSPNLYLETEATSDYSTLSTDIPENYFSGAIERKSLWRVYSFLSSITDSVTHTFLVSIFEGFFFWAYISKIEKDTMKQELVQSEAVIEYACMGLNSIAIPVIDHSIDVYKQIIEGPHTQNNEKIATIMLSVVLFLLSVGGTLACSLVRVKSNVPAIVVKTPDFSKDQSFDCKIIGKELLRTLYSSALSILMIGVYEAIFFQLVVYKYRPIPTEKVMIRMLRACKRGELKIPKVVA